MYDLDDIADSIKVESTRSNGNKVEGAVVKGGEHYNEGHGMRFSDKDNWRMRANARPLIIIRNGKVVYNGT